MSEGNVIVALDTHLTDELIEEGFVREIIPKLQTMRKEADFNVMDNIDVYIDGNRKILSIAENNGGMIEEDVLARNIRPGTAEGYTKEWDVNGEKVTFTVVRL